MGKPKHGRCKRGIRPVVGSIGRPGVGLGNVRRVFWKAIADGLPSEDAAIVAGVSPAVGCRWFRQNGGMPNISLIPPSGRFLALAEREEIALLRAQQLGIREIARRIGRSPSTISRELIRNAATRGGYVEYRATTAQWHAERRAKRPKHAKLAVNETLRKYVQDRLGGEITNEAGKQVGPQLSWSRRRHGPRQDRGWATSWSPEQIANRLRIDFPEDESMRVSHEAIYQALYIEGRGALKRECSAFLRSGPPLRVPRARVKARGKHFVTPDVLIDQRPKNVEARDTPGHWEGDLIIGLESSAIGTLVERSTRFTMLLHLPRMAEHGKAREKNGLALAGYGAYAVRMAITDAMLPLPPGMRQSLTWDQGAEMAQHVRVKEATGMQIYFCEPRSPWQRGTNENTNGLLRQYFPKGTDLGRYSAQDLAAVTVALNNRPRKVLGCRTPAEVFAHHLSCANSSVATTG